MITLITAEMVSRPATGDRVIVGGYCRGCDRGTEEIGVISGLEHDPLYGQCYVIKLSGLNYHGNVTRVLIPEGCKLHPADRICAPFCEWCGRAADDHEINDYPGCREFYRDTGRPATPDDDLSAYRAPF
jgi:hypothetical protein